MFLKIQIQDREKTLILKNQTYRWWWRFA